MRITSAESVRELLSLDSGDQVRSWMERIVGPDVLKEDRYWRRVGDQMSNAGAIEASADEINPLVERIVNGIEAIVELRVGQSGTTHLIHVLRLSLCAVYQEDRSGSLMSQRHAA